MNNVTNWLKMQQTHILIERYSFNTPISQILSCIMRQMKARTNFFLVMMSYIGFEQKQCLGLPPYFLSFSSLIQKTANCKYSRSTFKRACPCFKSKSVRLCSCFRDQFNSMEWDSLYPLETPYY